MNETNNYDYIKGNFANITGLKEIKEPVYFYESLVITAVSTISLIFCVTNVVVFSQKQFKEKVFVYLKHESIFMTMNLLISVFVPLIQCNSCSFSKSLPGRVYFFVFEVYITSITEMSSLISTIMATVNCITMVDKKAAGCLFSLSNINVYVVVVFEILLSGILFFHQLFHGYIIRQDDGLQSFIKADFYNSLVSRICDAIVYTVRDGILVITLIALNVYLLVIVRRNLARKRKILTQKRSNIQDPREKKIKRSQKKLVKMVLVDSLVYFLSRMVILVYILFATFLAVLNHNYTLRLVVLDIVNILKELSYGMMFFVYFFFNKRFRNGFLKFKLCRMFSSRSEN